MEIVRFCTRQETPNISRLVSPTGRQDRTSIVEIAALSKAAHEEESVKAQPA